MMFGVRLHLMSIWWTGTNVLTVQWLRLLCICVQMLWWHSSYVSRVTRWWRWFASQICEQIFTTNITSTLATSPISLKTKGWIVIASTPKCSWRKNLKRKICLQFPGCDAGIQYSLLNHLYDEFHHMILWIGENNGTEFWLE